MTASFPIGTLILPEPARTEAWQRWRAALNVDTLSYESLQTLPALAPALPQWLQSDADAARIQGIVKMAWSRNQVRLQRCVEMHQALLRASIHPVALIGPLAWSLLTREDGVIRTIPDLTVLIQRRQLFHAVAVLSAQGWELRNPQPDSNTLDWSSNLALIKGDETLHLHWRLFPTSAHKAIGFENVFMERLRTIVWKGYEFQVLSAEADLLHRLTDRPSWDPVPWRADVLMTSFADIDWPRLRNLAVRYARFFEPTDVLERLMDLRRDWQLPIPELAPASAHTRGLLGRLRSLPWRA
jgi:hypothetical protein